MSDEDDSSSEDTDYRPSTKEVREAEGEERRNKRQRLAHHPTSHAKEWMRQLGFKPKSALEASRSDTKQAQVAEPLKQSEDGGARLEPRQTKQALSLPINIQAAAKALAAAKTALTSAAAQNAGQVSVLETRRFAGKDVQVRKLTSEAEASEIERRERERQREGLDAVLASLESAKKVNVLDKSRDDWGAFKSADRQVAEELEAYKKSGAKYLDKVDFLKRAELREYEADRDRRLPSDGTARGPR